MNNEAQDLAAHLGLKLWTTDLFLPRYREGEVGNWRIDARGGIMHDWGYYTGPCMLEKLPLLLRRVLPTAESGSDLWQVWMSLTPHEIESQELGCRYAFGHTVVMGLGMGWIAANVALNRKVTKVTVIELDQEVIDLFTLSGALESIPEEARRKIVIEQANALEWIPASGHIDFLYADIWRKLDEPGTLDEVRQMQTNVHADQIYYWGQEIGIYNAVGSTALDLDTIHNAINRVIRLPLLVPIDRDYPAMIERVMRNRVQRRLLRTPEM